MHQTYIMGCFQPFTLCYFLSSPTPFFSVSYFSTLFSPFIFIFCTSNGFYPSTFYKACRQPNWVTSKTHQNPLIPMATGNLLSLLILLHLSSQCICTSGKWEAREFQHMPGLERKRKDQTFGTFSSSYGRKRLNLGMKFDDSINPPATTLPSSTTPITNPANFPPFTATPTVVTVPASNPTSVTPMNPPITTVPTSTNPITPVTNPATTYPTPVSGGNIPAAGGNVPMTSPSVPSTTTNVPITPGQTWCIARSGTTESSLQAGLDYACGIGGADCSMIQDGSSCYNPNSIENHASYAFNSYFQKNPVPTSCDFGGSAMLVNTNPSTGSCIYPSSASPAVMPSSTLPPATTTSTSGPTGLSSGVPRFGGYISPPSVSNTSDPASGFPTNFGPDSPPIGNSVPADSAALQPIIGFIILVVSFSAGKLILST